jgi:hypothetical protein
MSRRRRRRDPVEQELWELGLLRELTPGQLQQPKWRERIAAWRRVAMAYIEAGEPVPGEGIRYLDVLLRYSSMAPIGKRRRRRRFDTYRPPAHVRYATAEQGDTDKQNDRTPPSAGLSHIVDLPFWRDEDEEEGSIAEPAIGSADEQGR